MTDRETPSAPHEQLAANLSSRVNQTVTAVLESAGISTWNLLEKGSHGRVEISGDRMSYLVSGRAANDEKVATHNLNRQYR